MGPVELSRQQTTLIEQPWGALDHFAQSISNRKKTRRIFLSGKSHRLNSRQAQQFLLITLEEQHKIISPIPHVFVGISPGTPWGLPINGHFQGGWGAFEAIIEQLRGHLGTFSPSPSMKGAGCTVLFNLSNTWTKQIEQHLDSYFEGDLFKV
ncbi:hypothetical protein CEXT_633661 [Caerostris extrusa]|uniref:Uncharacterized protein n=1 Tax=Caerostris extrusa TaxID=172846 RepID=A0AAV4RIX3_CAEEX|nr:hypothetical protein CEXT_633661 [Caerostris extrusa]